jgi:hypothetical protein
MRAKRIPSLSRSGLAGREMRAKRIPSLSRSGLAGREIAFASLALVACALPPSTGERANPIDVTPAAEVPNQTPLTPTGVAMIDPPFDVTSTAATMAEWPHITAGIRERAVTSFDRTGGNDDGFGGSWSEIATDPNGEHVLFDEVGPGVVRTIWLTSAIDGNSPLSLGKLHFYFDGETAARITADSDEFFTRPLAEGNHQSTGGFASWQPIVFTSRLRITVDKPAGFYQVHYDTLPANWRIASSTAIDANLVDLFRAQPSTLPLEPIDTRTGAGILDVLRITPLVLLTDATIAAGHVVIWFDGAEKPQIDVPLNWFFGSGRGVAPVNSVAWTLHPDLLESRIPMPYSNGLRVAVTGIDAKVTGHIGVSKWDPSEFGTLEVVLNQTPTVANQDFVYADVTGAGKLIATVLAVDPQTGQNKHWWEGDLRTRVDGARTPVIHGTGHEDDHLGGWSNEFFSRPYSLPLQGAPRTDLYDTGTDFQINGACSMYRLWPGITFLHGLRHSVEHGSQNTVSAVYASAAFVYRQSRPRAAFSDGYDVPGASKTSAFEGELSDAITANVGSGLAEFDLLVDPINVGMDLRRMFDRSESPSRARLEVDGIAVGSFETVGPTAATREWSERDITIPPVLTKGKSKVHIRWVPESGKSLSARFESYSLLP